MGGRYLVTGVQLGMLVGIGKQDERQLLVDRIGKAQYVFDSKRDVEKDAHDIEKSQK